MTTKTESVSKPKQPSPTEMWTRYKVSWLFLTSLCGSVPDDPEITEAWLNARTPKVKPAGAKSIDQIQTEVFDTIAAGNADEPAPPKLVFQRHNGGLVMRAATIRAHIKDCARVLSAQFISKIKGERAFSTRVINAVYLDPIVYWVPILRPDDNPVTQADGSRDKPVHVRGPRGEPLNALKTFEFINPPSKMEFVLQVLGKSVSQNDLEYILTYGGTHGYAGERGDGEGRYSFTIESVE